MLPRQVDKQLFGHRQVSLHKFFWLCKSLGKNLPSFVVSTIEIKMILSKKIISSAPFLPKRHLRTNLGPFNLMFVYWYQISRIRKLSVIRLCFSSTLQNKIYIASTQHSNACMRNHYGRGKMKLYFNASSSKGPIAIVNITRILIFSVDSRKSLLTQS